MIEGLAHVCIAAHDLAATERFYCEGLGLKKVFNFIRGGEVVGFYLRVADNTYIEVFHQPSGGPQGGFPIRHLCLQVSDIDAVVARLKSNGYDVTDKNLGADRSWQAWTTDPTGVRIEFHQYTPQSSQITGEDCVLG